jgi:hypothetical protein
MSTSSRGNYYKLKTKKFLESKGFTVQLTEFVSSRPIGNGKMIWTKKDVFGSDGIAMNGEEIIFWNAKATTSDVVQGINKHKSQGKIEFAKFPFPNCVKRKLYIWEPRKEPVIIDCI